MSRATSAAPHVFATVHLPILALLNLLAPEALRAQSTADRTKLSFGLSVGAITGTNVWSISGQPIVDNNSQVDTLSLGRTLNGSVAATINLAYFPGNSLGLTGEIALLGGTYVTTCRVTNPGATVQNTNVCSSFRQSTISARNVAVTVGGLYRVMTHRRLSPYVSGRAGLVLGAKNSITVSGERVGSLVRFYRDPEAGGVVPVAILGAGMTLAAGPGYQFRWEVRNTLMGLDEVTGVTSGRPNQEPDHQRVYHQRWTFIFGLEVVLDRVPGHRY